MKTEYLLIVVQCQINWFYQRADHLDRGHERTLQIRDGIATDVSAHLAQFYRHRAGNLGCILSAYSLPMHFGEKRPDAPVPGLNHWPT